MPIVGADFASESYSQEIYDEIVWKININNITGSTLIPNMLDLPENTTFKYKITNVNGTSGFGMYHEWIWGEMFVYNDTTRQWIKVMNETQLGWYFYYSGTRMWSTFNFLFIPHDAYFFQIISAECVWTKVNNSLAPMENYFWINGPNGYDGTANFWNGASTGEPGEKKIVMSWNTNGVLTSYQVFNGTSSWTKVYEIEYLSENPNNPKLISPIDNANGTALTVDLKVNVSDPDGDLMNVSFYNAIDDSLIGIDTNVASGETALTSWSGLSTDKMYEWYVIVDDGFATRKSAIWSFTPDNPPSVSIIFPENNSIYAGLTITLKVRVTDPDGDLLNVSFYNCSVFDTNFIGFDANVSNGEIASISFSKLNINDEYWWYVIVDDGILSIKSSIWIFTTTEKTSTPQIPGFELFTCLNCLLIIISLAISKWKPKRIFHKLMQKVMMY
ncbi:MAG: hypothetical protein ACTSRP_16610 [Candidatus Helarchaeota archaeon]